eukprot:XP_028355734.1 dynein regulatory complex subunit 3 isoform X5 [Physeter catodon]
MRALAEALEKFPVWASGPSMSRDTNPNQTPKPVVAKKQFYSQRQETWARGVLRSQPGLGLEFGAARPVRVSPTPKCAAPTRQGVSIPERGPHRPSPGPGRGQQSRGGGGVGFRTVTLTQSRPPDLSFNNIEAIEGLDTLVNLEDLSLFNNRVSKIDSLDALVKLQKELAEMKHQYSIDELKHQESLMQARLEDERARSGELEEHKAAFVEHLNGPFLFDSMYAEDVEGSQLSHLPGVGELLQTYKDKFVIICLNIFEYGLKQQEKRKAELNTFMGCVQEAVQEKQEQSKAKIAKFEEKHLLSLSAIRDESELTNFEIKMAEHSEDITELVDVLMTLEMQLVEQLEETVNMFERNIIDLVGLFVENVRSLMAQCRDLENHHHEKLLEIAISTLEKRVKGELDEDLPDAVRSLFVDKDTILNAVGASHDIHLLKIDNREDELVTRVNSWCAHLVDKIHKDEIVRNRRRVKEIYQYVEHVQSELDSLEFSDLLD